MERLRNHFQDFILGSWQEVYHACKSLDGPTCTRPLSIWSVDDSDNSQCFRYRGATFRKGCANTSKTKSNRSRFYGCPRDQPEAYKQFRLSFLKVTEKYPLDLPYQEWLPQARAPVIAAYSRVLRNVMSTGYPPVDMIIQYRERTSDRILDALVEHEVAPHLPHEFWMLLKKYIDIPDSTIPQPSDSYEPRDTTDTPAPWGWWLEAREG